MAKGKEGEEEEEEGEDEEEKRAKEKARIDQLWASFKQDTAAPLHKPADIKGKVIRVFLCASTHYPLDLPFTHCNVLL